MANKVTGDLYYRLDGKMVEIKRQLRQREGYPHSPEGLDLALQRLVEGRLSPSLVVAATTTLPRLPAEETRRFASLLGEDELALLPTKYTTTPECRVTTWDVLTTVSDEEVVKQLIFQNDWRQYSGGESCAELVDVVRHCREWTMTLPQVLRMVMKTRNGEFTGLDVAGENGCEREVEFAFLSRARQEGSLMVGLGRLGEGRQLKYLLIRPFGHTLGQWCRFLLPNAPRRVVF